MEIVKWKVALMVVSTVANMFRTLFQASSFYTREHFDYNIAAL